MTDQLISIIVPVYKVEKYLDQCVASIAAQTYKNLEIILVDDGSPDNCSAMCDAWAAKDRRIRVIHKKNGGLSDARNAGLDVARGSYVGFVDSDDVVHEAMFSVLADIAERTQAGIVECNYEMFGDNSVPFPEEVRDESPAVWDTTAAMKELLRERRLKHTAWNKLYHARIFEDLRFPAGKLHEDVYTTFQAIDRAGCVAKVELSLYGYRQRSGSIMSSDFSMRNLDALDARVGMLAYVRKSYPHLEGLAQSKLLGICHYLGQQALRCGDPDLCCEVMKIIRPIYHTEAKHLQYSPRTKERLWLVFGSISFSSCCRVRNWLRIGI